MNKTKLATALVSEIKLMGARQYLEKVQQELSLLYQEFGRELFPHGMPILTRPETVYVKDKAAKARELIEGAERLHKKYGKRGRPHGAKRTLKRETVDRMWPSSAPDSPQILVSEAAKMFGVSDSAVRLWIKNGKLQAAPTSTDPRKRMQVLREEVMRKLAEDQDFKGQELEAVNA